jgi:hypothetical protein
LHDALAVEQLATQAALVVSASRDFFSPCAIESPCAAPSITTAKAMIRLYFIRTKKFSLSFLPEFVEASYLNFQTRRRLNDGNFRPEALKNIVSVERSSSRSSAPPTKPPLDVSSVPSCSNETMNGRSSALHVEIIGQKLVREQRSGFCGMRTIQRPA